jgi:ubiquinone/menaquinone biosynthesis C-methylase UbiE
LRRGDQSGNASDATQRNAAAEGVADRAELRTADMTALPFEDDSFDVVVSNAAMHNVKGRAGRDRAIEQAVRVLRLGGRLMIADIFGTRQYSAHLAELGMAGITLENLGCDCGGVARGSLRVSLRRPSRGKVLCVP